MNVKHVVCPQKVLQAVTDLSLVRVCQERRVSVLSTERAVWPAHRGTDHRCGTNRAVPALSASHHTVCKPM